MVVLCTKCNFKNKYPKLDFLKKSNKKISRMVATPQSLKDLVPFLLKKENIFNNLKQVIPQNRKKFWENI